MIIITVTGITLMKELDIIVIVIVIAIIMWLLSIQEMNPQSITFPLT